jgi:hypothetical protein
VNRLGNGARAEIAAGGLEGDPKRRQDRAGKGRDFNRRPSSGRSRRKGIVQHAPGS